MSDASTAAAPATWSRSFALLGYPAISPACRARSAGGACALGSTRQHPCNCAIVQSGGGLKGV
eukprot:2036542-Pyramimonas_sp.AAC.1